MPRPARARYSKRGRGRDNSRERERECVCGMCLVCVVCLAHQLQTWTRHVWLAQLLCGLCGVRVWLVRRVGVARGGCGARAFSVIFVSKVLRCCHCVTDQLWYPWSTPISSFGKQLSVTNSRRSCFRYADTAPTNPIVDPERARMHVIK